MTDAVRASDPFRALGVAVTAGLVAGVLVVGVAGRVVMRISAIAADNDGILTEGGNRVGDITVGGTIALIVFGGGFFGLFGGFVFFAARPWLPGTLGQRALLFAVALPPMIGATVIATESRDFFILDPPELNVAMFVALFALYGAVVVLADGLLEARFPVSNARSEGALIPAIVLAVPVAVITLALLADGETAAVAPFFLVMGAATVARTADPGLMFLPERQRRAVAPLGYGALLAACVVGGWFEALEIRDIV